MLKRNLDLLLSSKPHRHKRQHLCRFIRTCATLSESATRIVMPLLTGSVDRHNGVKVDLADVPADMSEESFQVLLKESLSHWESNGNTSAWLQVPIMHSRFIAMAAEQGFLFHHAEHGSSTLYKWLDQSREDKIPRFSTHQIGSAGVVLKDNGEVLMVQDRHVKKRYWKFPGGMCELGEDIGETAEREVYEETGIKTEFQSILGFRQQHDHPGAFGRSDLYVVCRMTPLTFDLNPCPDEIFKCEWKTVDEALNSSDIGPITERILHVLKLGLEKGFDSIDVSKHGIVSQQTGKIRSYMYYRPLPDNKC